MTTSLVALWLKAVLTAAEIDTALFSVHSTTGASSCASAKVGITTNDILKAADWSSESVFQKFYYKPSDNLSYGRAVLSNSATNNTIDMRDWAFWNIIHNGSDHEVVACYLEEIEVENINSPTHPPEYLQV